MRLISLLPILFYFFLCNSIFAESIEVKYQGIINLKSFSCQKITNSSFIRRLCYNKQEKKLILLLNNTYYQYCEVDSNTVINLINAKSLGQYYNKKIKGKYPIKGYCNLRNVNKNYIKPVYLKKELNNCSIVNGHYRRYKNGKIIYIKPHKRCHKV